MFDCDEHGSPRSTIHPAYPAAQACWDEKKRTDVTTGGRSRVDCNDDPALELEREGGRSVVDLDAARRVRHVVGVELEERGRLHTRRGKSRSARSALERICTE
jgi:hypothetical protein